MSEEPTAERAMSSAERAMFLRLYVALGLVLDLLLFGLDFGLWAWFALELVLGVLELVLGVLELVLGVGLEFGFLGFRLCFVLELGQANEGQLRVMACAAWRILELTDVHNELAE